MPITASILDHSILGPEIRRRLEERLQEELAEYRRKGFEEGRRTGFEEGRRRGLEEGRQEGALAVLGRLIEKRFGEIPPSLAERLARLPFSELQELCLQVLDAKTLNDLLGYPRSP